MKTIIKRNTGGSIILILIIVLILIGIMFFLKRNQSFIERQGSKEQNQNNISTSISKKTDIDNIEKIKIVNNNNNNNNNNYNNNFIKNIGKENNESIFEASKKEINLLINNNKDFLNKKNFKNNKEKNAISNIQEDLINLKRISKNLEKIKQYYYLKKISEEEYIKKIEEQMEKVFMIKDNIIFFKSQLL